MNHLIQELLRSRVYFVLATLLLTYIFWWSGVNKVWDFSAAKKEMAHFGLEPQALFAVLTITVQLLGSWLIISASRLAWLGALMLSVFILQKRQTWFDVCRFPLQGRFGLIRVALYIKTSGPPGFQSAFQRAHPTIATLQQAFGH